MFSQWIDSPRITQVELPLGRFDVSSGLNVVAIKRAIGFINFVSVLIGKELAQTVILRKSC